MSAEQVDFWGLTEQDHTDAKVADEMMLAEYGAKYLDTIAGRMVAENVIDTSDAEIERSLGECVCSGWLVPVAKHLRDRGLLQPAIAALA